MASRVFYNLRPQKDLISFYTCRVVFNVLVGIFLEVRVKGNAACQEIVRNTHIGRRGAVVDGLHSG